MSIVRVQEVNRWDQAFSRQQQDQLLDLLEDGQVLLFENLRFALLGDEASLLTPSVSDGRSKNIAVDPVTGRVAGSSLTGPRLELLRRLVVRFSRQSRDLLDALFPSYAAKLQTRLASYRPVQVEGRVSSERKDDTRLHVDAFASRPNQGRRILRMFSNINPEDRPRTWLVGEPFERYAQRFLPKVRPQWPLEGTTLRVLGVTKSRRTAYDHLMLGLHDRGKLDRDYQRDSFHERFDFQPGSTWICFTDQVLHAALGGHYMLEQTFMLPVEAMRNPDRSPLRTLERLTGRALV